MGDAPETLLVATCGRQASLSSSLSRILHLSRYRWPDWRLSYLRTGAGAEIDLIIERPGRTIALIEIKSTDRVDERDIRNLARFARDFRDPFALCISQEPEHLRIGPVRCLPLRAALVELGLHPSGRANMGRGETSGPASAEEER